MTIGIYDSGNGIYYTPDKQATKEVNRKVLFQAFGDGYEQRAVDGINASREKFSLSYSGRSKEEIDDLIAFLDSKKGVIAFTLTMPDTNNTTRAGEKDVKVVTETYGMNFAYDDFYSANVTLRRVYEA